MHTFEGHNNGIIAVAFSPDGEKIASASLDQTVKLWKTDGTLLNTFQSNEGWFRGIDFSPVSVATPKEFGTKIASASTDKTIKIWELDGTLLHTLEGHKGAVWMVAFSPDGKKIASTSEDKTVIVWNLERILSKDSLAHGCNWVSDYLKNNSNVSQSERNMCDGVGNSK